MDLKDIEAIAYLMFYDHRGFDGLTERQQDTILKFKLMSLIAQQRIKDQHASDYDIFVAQTDRFVASLGCLSNASLGTYWGQSYSDAGKMAADTIVAMGIHVGKDVALQLAAQFGLPYLTSFASEALKRGWKIARDASGRIVGLIDKSGKAVAESEVNALVHSLNPRTRLPRTRGSWEGTAGNSPWRSEIPEVNAVTGGNPIQFIDGRPNFSPWAKGRFTFKAGQLNGTNSDFDLVYQRIAEKFNLKNKTAAKNWLRERGLTPHHSDCNTIELIPSDLHGNIPHVGSASDLRGGYLP